jgi:cytidylate kinase
MTQIICISRGTHTGGKELADKLAGDLGYACLSREELTDRATHHGIPVGKLEMAVLKRRPLSDALAIEIDRYKAFITASLCERALDDSIVYHGRTGHLVLQDVTHILRIRAIADTDYRIGVVMARMNLDRKKARKYCEEVDEDRERWVRTQYGVAWESPSLYDVTINLSNLSVDNSARALVHMAALPEFQETPATHQLVRDLLLSSRCRLAIGADPRTADMNVRVRAEKGAVSVTFQPWQAKRGELLPAVLEKLAGIERLVCTPATTNILFIGERFDPRAESVGNLVQLAQKWNAAVEMVRLASEDGPDERAEAVAEPAAGTERPQANGGILDDTDEPEAESDPAGVSETRDRLIQEGKFGGLLSVGGGREGLLKRLSHNANYSLVVVGDVFHSKGEAVRKRQARELVGALGEKLRLPVIAAEELKSQYLAGARQWLNVAVFGALVGALYYLLFSFQEPVLAFLARPLAEAGLGIKLLCALAVFAFVPVAASIISAFWNNVLRLLRME